MDSAGNTVGSVVQFFERLISDFSWRRLGLVAGLIILAGSALVVFELYTQTLRLNRMDREAALLERILLIDKALQGITDENLIASLDGLKERLRAVTRAEDVSASVPPGWLKAAYTALPWLLMCLAAFFAPGGGTARPSVVSPS